MSVYILKEYILDVAVIGIILWCAVNAYRKGFVVAGLGFLPMGVAMAAAYFCSPFCSKLLRATPIYPFLTQSVYKTLKLNANFGEKALGTQTEVIQNMSIPSFLKNSLLENNNPVAYRIFNVDKLQDYVASFLANICLNILSVIVVFIIVFIAVKLFLAALNLVMKLPMLSFVNRLSGLIIGTVQGVGIVWIAGLILTFFNYNPKFYGFFDLLSHSRVANVFYENNLLLLMILKIFA